MGKKPKWIVFDVGGVLLDWHSGLRQTAKYLRVDEKKLLNSLLKYLQLMELGKISPEDGWSKIVKDVDKEAKGEKVLKIWLSGCRWLPESWKLAKDLKQSGYDLAICTNNWNNIVKNFLSKKPEFSIFNKIIDSSSEDVRKPDIRIFEITEQKIQAKGEDIYFIEDSEENVQTASVFGWRVFYFQLLDDEGKTSCNKIRQELL